MLGGEVAERGGQRGEAANRVFGDVGDQLVFQRQRRGGRFGEQALDDRAAGLAGAVGGLVDAVDEFALGVGAVDGRGDVEAAAEHLGGAARGGGAGGRPLFHDLVAGGLGGAADDELLPLGFALGFDLDPHFDLPRR